MRTGKRMRKKEEEEHKKQNVQFDQLKVLKKVVVASISKTPFLPLRLFLDEVVEEQMVSRLKSSPLQIDYEKHPILVVIQ